MNTVPDKMLAWPLFGAGFENLGKDEKPCTVPVPAAGDDEILVKIDAIGLCFSDVKLIRAGETHPRVISKNLKENPVIPGHEAVMTIVRTGKKVSTEFKVGQRFIIQADIYVKGKGYAYGYAIDGGMAQYSKIDQRILNGDEGCYLIPLPDSIPAGIAALMEPWTCVKASYMIEHRKTPLSGGSILIASEKGNSSVYKPGKLLLDAKPSKIAALNLSDAFVSELKNSFKGTAVETVSSIKGEDLYDDLFLCDIKDRALVEKLARNCKKNAVVNFIGDYPDEAWSFDIGNIHYQGWFYQGANGKELSAGYGKNIRAKLKKNGTCWLPGGAGAMGQMHTQLAVEAEDGPSRILVSDMDNVRISKVTELLRDTIKKRGIEFKTLNPSSFASPAEFDKAVKDFAPEGFDDIVMLVPVIPVLNASARHLKADGLMNIFAGIPAGKEGLLNIKGIAEKGMRYIGSSGSLTAHLKHTLKLVENGKLAPATALAAIGGMNELKKGLDSVANAKFPGKTVIFPNCENMPLTTMENIGNLSEELKSTLDKDGFYTKKTEEKLFELFSN